MSACRVVVAPSTVCHAGQRYTVTVVARDGSTLATVDAVGREQAIRHALQSARWTRRAMIEFRGGADIR